jgi:ABC-type multidrug transport system permease subunit
MNWYDFFFGFTAGICFFFVFFFVVFFIYNKKTSSEEKMIAEAISSAIKGLNKKDLN